MSERKVDSGEMESRLDRTHQSSGDYESETEERGFLHRVGQGLKDLEDGRELSLADVKRRLGVGSGAAKLSCEQT